MSTLADMRLPGREQNGASDITTNSDSRSGWHGALRIVAKDLGTIALLTLLMPLNLALTCTALIVRPLLNRCHSYRGSLAEDAKTVLISGGKMTKALQLARLFRRSGHRVILCETSKYWLTGHRFSAAVDKFVITADPTSPDYAASLRRIVEQEGVDFYVPVCSPLASLHDSEAIEILSPYCKVVHPSLEKIKTLDDKFKFARSARSLGLGAPKSFLITDPQQVLEFDFSDEHRDYVLKSISYDSVRRLDLTKLPCASDERTEAFVRSLPISESQPWVMQEFIPGKEFCTHSTIVDGELRVHCCCESSAFQVNYEHIDDPEIESWVRRYAAGMNLTGQVSFDFIRADDDGGLYAIECNPRTHSAITTFYDSEQVADAYLAGTASDTLTPRSDSRPTYWLYHELWRMVKSLANPARFRHRLQIIRQGKEAIFDWQDPLPFFLVHHFQIPTLLFRDLRHRRGFVRIDFNIGKLVQRGGD